MFQLIAIQSCLWSIFDVDPRILESTDPIFLPAMTYDIVQRLFYGVIEDELQLCLVVKLHQPGSKVINGWNGWNIFH